MISIGVICAVLAFVLLVMAAVGVASRINLLAAGLALWLLSTLLGRVLVP